MLLDHRVLSYIKRMYDERGIDNHVRCDRVITDRMNPGVSGPKSDEALEHSWPEIRQRHEEERQHGIAWVRKRRPALNQVHRGVSKSSDNDGCGEGITE